MTKIDTYRQNLEKQRLVRIDPDWVAACQARLDH